MAQQELQFDLWDLISPLSKTIDAMSPAVARHHMRVAYLALRLCDELKFDLNDKRDIVVAASLHDVGAFSLDERLDILEFEETRATQHAHAGFALLRDFEPFANIAEIVRFHHVPWNNGKETAADGQKIMSGSHILHLADRAAVLIRDEKPVLGQSAGIVNSIKQRRGNVFVPEFVDAFERIAGKDYIWLEAVSERIEIILKKNAPFSRRNTNLDELRSFTRLISRLIDFRSGFTATHSSGVAATAMALGHRAGFSEMECRMLEIAAQLHDLGKLAIPSEMIEKQGKLTPDEWQVMRTHVFYTYQILEPIDALEVITSWGALHQERLDGSGYPFSYTDKQLPVGARIMAVADVFTSVTEDRPYRKGMDKEAVCNALETMAGKGELDATLVNELLIHFDEFNRIRAEAQARAAHEYRRFRNELALLAP